MPFLVPFPLQPYALCPKSVFKQVYFESMGGDSDTEHAVAMPFTLGAVLQ